MRRLNWHAVAVLVTVTVSALAFVNSFTTDTTAKVAVIEEQQKYQDKFLSELKSTNEQLHTELEVMSKAILRIEILITRGVNNGS